MGPEINQVPKAFKVLENWFSFLFVEDETIKSVGHAINRCRHIETI